MKYLPCLLTATCLAGVAAADPPATTAPAPLPVAQTPAPDPPPRLLDRIRNFFKPRPPERKEATTPPTKAAQLGTPAPQMPVKQAMTVTAMRPNLELSKTDLEKVGHENDYTWITGKLFRDGGRWLLRYGGPYEVDRYEGAVVLAPGPMLAKCHEGDLVCVHGTVSGAAPHAVYQVKELNVIEVGR